MSTKIRAKFQCVEETRTSFAGGRTLKFQPVYAPDLPEDRRFSKATPSGRLEMYVDNPAADFKVGTFYYLDFIEADKDE